MNSYNSALNSLGGWIDACILVAPNKQLLERQLLAIDCDEALIHFLHRFVLFNDALAARVPFLAGLIHLTPGLFIDPDADGEFCRQANGRIAAYVAEAASDEYRMAGDRNLVHQYLSQKFFHAALEHYRMSGAAFDKQYPLPATLSDVLAEARIKYFERPTPGDIFAALGFHVGLEFFADQEFNLVDQFLRRQHPALVASLEGDGADRSDYLWLSTHTVVEIGHYRAGLSALKSSLSFCHPRHQAPMMLASIKQGFNSFVDLQRRYYEGVRLDFA